MNINLTPFGATALERVQRACADLALGKPVLLMDDPDRENEGDLIVAAELISTPIMAQLINDCSGIVCLALTGEAADNLALPPMVTDNSSKNKTAFTVSIEAKEGVTTGVSAADRVQTIRTAIASDAKADDLARPGHVFPLRSAPGGALTRRGHTEGGVDLCRLAKLSPAAVLCELMHKDGSMMKGRALVDYAHAHQLVLLTIEDLVQVLKSNTEQAA
ncbi:3,4-dihydroxy-2-butanone-4-phosphate synthase [Pseudoalteromonas sp. BDTF-M6]|uniref:3,4-dihydroxy-2-butanone-4-phosphate synthase n=1 Tax=Pseudoalteromonas sp. BDTF-M6 TaxID=2796132 RepID=UPI001BB03888|nr:3,4-dihydroxy-2-butanone-4-phosphate synthase [Pseudoalteromonas sp. BDTF-M6]MBS3799289.1 3,4-dihydroxy-2-butanone-4-phosphate synthase [Pseudoalteromonas sp. BDTF-M6]